MTPAIDITLPVWIPLSCSPDPELGKVEFQNEMEGVWQFWMFTSSVSRALILCTSEWYTQCQRTRAFGSRRLVLHQFLFQCFHETFHKFQFSIFPSFGLFMRCFLGLSRRVTNVFDMQRTRRGLTSVRVHLKMCLWNASCFRHLRDISFDFGELLSCRVLKGSFSVGTPFQYNGTEEFRQADKGIPGAVDSRHLHFIWTIKGVCCWRKIRPRIQCLILQGKQSVVGNTTTSKTSINFVLVQLWHGEIRYYSRESTVMQAEQLDNVITAENKCTQIIVVRTTHNRCLHICFLSAHRGWCIVLLINLIDICQKSHSSFSFLPRPNYHVIILSLDAALGEKWYFLLLPGFKEAEFATGNFFVCWVCLFVFLTIGLKIIKLVFNGISTKTHELLFSKPCWLTGFGFNCVPFCIAVFLRTRQQQRR